MDIYSILCSKSQSDFHTKRYWKFISERINRPAPQGVTEGHHICPKALDLFPEYGSFSTHPWNRIYLTPREHYLAHWMLFRAFGGSQTKAFVMMSGRQGKTSSRVYESARSILSVEMTTDNPNSDGSLSKAAWVLATDDRRAKQSEIAKAVNLLKRKPKVISTWVCQYCEITFTDYQFAHRIKPRLFCSQSCCGKNRMSKIKAP